MTRFAEDISSSLYGNPHSASPSSQRTTQRIEEVRHRLLSFFKADPDHYDLVFVANATAAIKLVGEAFSASGFQYSYHIDSHTSLVGLSMLASSSQCFTDIEELDITLTNGIEKPRSPADQTLEGALRLIAFPAQSNMTGYRPPYKDWTQGIKSQSDDNTFTFLDAAAYAMTSQLDLTNPPTSPDLVAASLYKIFGFPDLGVLLIRKLPSLSKIFTSRKYFGGGTVDMVIVKETPLWYSLKPPSPNLHSILEDGTLPFHNIIAVSHALDVHERLYGSMSNISLHTSRTLSYLYTRLQNPRHPNGQPLVHIYSSPQPSPPSPSPSPLTQGPTLAFNLLSPQGTYIPKTLLTTLACSANIHLRAGGLCNPGGISTHLSLSPLEMKQNFHMGVRCGNEVDIVGGRPTGVCRVSLGAMSTEEDVEGFVSWVEKEFGGWDGEGGEGGRRADI